MPQSTKKTIKKQNLPFRQSAGNKQLAYRSLIGLAGLLQTRPTRLQKHGASFSDFFLEEKHIR